MAKTYQSTHACPYCGGKHSSKAAVQKCRKLMQRTNKGGGKKSKRK